MTDIITYQNIEQDNFIKVISNMCPGDVSFDFEANGLDVFDESVSPFSFSVVYEDDPELESNRYYFVMRKPWSSEEKSAFLKFIKERRCWCYNFSYEGGMIWRYIGEFCRFDDVHCLIIADGLCKITRDENNAKVGSGLKAMAKLYLKAKNWSDIPWTCVERLQIIAKYIKPRIDKDKLDWLCNNFFSKYLDSNYFDDELVESDCSKKQWEVVLSLRFLQEFMSKNEIYSAIIKSEFDCSKISLRDIPDRIVGPYCVYDSYWTIKLKKLLYPKWGEQIYKVYLKQNWISCVMLGYSIYWDTKSAENLENKYKDYVKVLYKELLLQPQFLDALIQGGLISETNIPDIQTCDDISQFKNYWNVNCNVKDSVDIFYNALYKSKEFCNMMSANVMHEFIVQYDDYFFLEVSKSNIENYDLLKLDLCELLKIEDISKLPEYQKRWDSGEVFKIPGSRLIKHNNYSNISKIFATFIVGRGEILGNDIYKFKLALRDATTIVRDHRGSLAADYIEKLYDACINCGYIEPTVNLSEMRWEFKLIYCLKFIKKMFKQLTTYLRGSLGFENLRGAELGSLRDLPKRNDSSANQGLWILNTMPNAVETKRWSSGSHTIPWNTDVRGLIIPRFEEDLVVHYDYSQSEVRLLAALSKCKPLLEAFRNGADIHRNTAAGIWRKSPEYVTDAERRFSKMACVVGSTKIPLMNGEFKTIKEIYESGMRNFKCYSFDIDSNKFAEGNVCDVQLTKYVKKLAKVTFDNGKSIECTVDHRFLMPNGKYVEAQDLKINSEVETCKVRIPAYGSSAPRGINFYKEIYDFKYEYKTGTRNPSISRIAKGKWIPIHQAQMSAPKGYHVDHIDENSLNNEKSNLQILNPVDNSRKSSPSRKLAMTSNVVRKLVKSGLEFNEANYNSVHYGNNPKYDKLSDADLNILRKFYDNYLRSLEYSNSNYRKRGESYLKVAKVEILELQEEVPVYDLSVDTYHNYAIALDDYNYVYVHNTFSILYLATVESFANSFLQGDVGKAQEIYDGFFRTYPEVKAWQDAQNQAVVKDKKVHTLFGDDIYIECNESSRRSVREAAKRSVNYPIQSSSSSIAGMCIWNLWDKLQKPENFDILAIPGTFTHDSSDWEIRPDFLPRFFKLANETAVDDVYRDFGVAMAIDFEIGISQNHMMEVEDAKFIDENGIEGLEFKFTCHEDTFQKIIDRLKKYWLVDVNIKKTKIKIDTLANAFKTRQGFSLNTGIEQKVFSGDISLLRRKK